MFHNHTSPFLADFKKKLLVHQYLNLFINPSITSFFLKIKLISRVFNNKKRVLLISFFIVGDFNFFL